MGPLSQCQEMSWWSEQADMAQQAELSYLVEAGDVSTHRVHSTHRQQDKITTNTGNKSRASYTDQHHSTQSQQSKITLETDNRPRLVTLNSNATFF